MDKKMVLHHINVMVCFNYFLSLILYIVWHQPCVTAEYQNNTAAFWLF